MTFFFFVVVVVVVVVLVNIFLGIIIKTTPYKNLYKNKVVDPSEKRLCAKFEPLVTNSFAKNG